MSAKKLPPIESSPLGGGLLTVARDIPADWEGGVSFTPRCGTTGVWPKCPSVGRANKSVGSTSKPADVSFDPFMLYSHVNCGGQPFETELLDQANHALRVQQSMQLARQLVFSDPDVDNPDLATTAEDITLTNSLGAAPQRLRNSLGGLLTHAVECGMGEAVIHIPVVAMPHALSSGVEYRDGKYFLGHIPVSFDDYGQPDGSPNAGDNAWIYLTGPVEVGIGSPLESSVYENRLNQSTVLVEQLAILRFDPCCMPAMILSQVWP